MKLTPFHALVALATSSSGGAQCFDWASSFHGAGVSDLVLAQIVFDDGNGPALYVGGNFATAGDVVVNHVARWDGSSWSALASGVSGIGLAHVSAFAVFDDGSGPALYAGGNFTSAGGVAVKNVAKWDGSSWSPAGGGLNLQGAPEDTRVYALAAFDDGSGPALYAGGAFTRADGMNVANLARWNGTSWSQVGGIGANGIVRSFAVFDEGSGAKLFAGGYFSQINTTPVEYVGRWDGSTWSSVGTPSGLHWINSLATHDDGSGLALYAATQYATVRKWDGASWSQVGSGLSGTTNVLAVFDDGSGAQLYAGGIWSLPGGTSRIARWDGASWNTLGVANEPDGIVHSLATFDDGSGAELWAGGEFRHVGASPADFHARWNGASWSSFGASNSVDGELLALGEHAGELYLGGDFTQLSDVTAIGIGRWDGASWADVGGSLPPGGVARDMLAWNGTGSSSLFVGGSFNFAGGTQVNHVGRWDGVSWSALGTGIYSGGADVFAIEVHDAGAGEELYAGGNFSNAAAPGKRIARWTPSGGWSPLGSGVDAAVRALSSSNLSGTALLYVGGDFDVAGGVSASRFASWNGASWAEVGGGVSGGNVLALAELDDGSGPALYVAGDFATAGGIPASRIARWDGAAWTPLGSGCDGAVRALCVFDDGLGPQLYAGGDFTTAGGVPASHIARWNGVQWSALGSGTSARVRALEVFDDGSGPALFAGGSFTVAGGKPSLFFAKWGAACPCPPVSYCTAKTNSQGCLPSIYSTGTTSIAANNLRVKASNVLNNKNGLLFWGFAPKSSPFQGGTLCVQAPTIRTPIQSSDGNAPPDDCSGEYSFHFNASYMASYGVIAGERIYCQYWSRDPASPSTTGLTDALFFTACP